MKNKRIISIILILTIVFTFLGGTFAYLTWKSSNSQNTQVTFNLPANFSDYIDVKSEATFVGDFNVSTSYLDGIHSTVSISKKDYLKDVNVYATLYLKINEIGENMRKSSALKWVVTSGNSTNPGDILSQGNFSDKSVTDTITLLFYQEVTLEVEEYTVWVYLDKSENPSTLLSGETLDADVLTEINQVVSNKFEIISKSFSNSTIKATAVNSTYNIVSYAVTSSNTEPSKFTTISSAARGKVYNLEYSLTDNVIGVYYVWFKDSQGNVISTSISVDNESCTAPTILGSVVSNTWASSNNITISGGTCYSGIDHYEYCISTTSMDSTDCTIWVSGNSLTYDTNGTRYLFARAVSVNQVNIGGEGNDISTFTVLLDADTPVAPTITGTVESGTWTTKNVITISGSDSLSGINHYEYCNSTEEGSCTGTWKTYTSSITYSSCGKKYIFARAINNVPTTGTVSSPYEVFIKPKKPTITLTNSSGEVESDTWSLEDITVTITGTGNTSCVSKYEYCTSTTSNKSSDCTNWQTYSSSNKPEITYEGTTYFFARATNSDDVSSSIATARIKVSKTPPTCTLEVTSDGIKFKSYSDDTVAWGLSNSSTPVFDGTSTSTLALSAGTKYGFVKNEQGNIGTCIKEISTTTNTYTCSIDATPLYTCSKSATSLYTCTTSAAVSSSSDVGCNTAAKQESPSTQCASGYTYAGNSCSISYSCTSGHTQNGSTCSYSATASSYTCRTQTTTKHTCVCSGGSSSVPTTQNECDIYCNNYYYDYGDQSGTFTTTTTCPSPWTNAWISGSWCYAYQVSSCGSWTKVGTNYTCPSGGSLSSSTCSYTATASYSGTINCNKYSCSSGTLSGSNCVLTNKTSCDTGWTKSSVTGYSCSTGTLNGTKCEKLNQASCDSGWTQGDTVTDYSCSTGTLSGSKCYLYEQTSCSSGWTSQANEATCHTGTQYGNYCIEDVWTITLNNQSATTQGTTSLTLDLGASFPNITVPTRTGYTFGGYYSGTNGSGTQYYNASGTSTKTVTSSTPSTLYAKWTANTYTITYNANNGSGAPSATTYTYASSGTVTLSSTTPTRTGYTFKGWATSASATSATYSAGGTFNKNVASNTTLYAVWTANTYTITYNANNGSGAPSATTYTYASSGTVTLSSTKPTRTGYTFKGWSTSSSATSATYSAGGTFNKNVASNTTLYAVWTANTYTITYDANGGSGAPSATTYTYASSGTVTLSSTTPTRSGYTFKGWATSSSGSVAYSAGGTFNKNVASNTTLYAVWSASLTYYCYTQKQTCTNNVGCNYEVCVKDSNGNYYNCKTGTTKSSVTVSTSYSSKSCNVTLSVTSTTEYKWKRCRYTGSFTCGSGYTGSSVYYNATTSGGCTSASATCTAYCSNRSGVTTCSLSSGTASYCNSGNYGSSSPDSYCIKQTSESRVVYSW